tara:strand:- start:108 stop:482 length:375 start_codon:yes stop_codon:yes gene_type:complete
MNTYTLVTLITINIKTGELINNLINQQQIEFNILNNNNTYKVNLKSNMEELDINILLKEKKEIFCIITENDYKSLLNLMYNDEKQIINYNNDYFLLEIKPYLTFNSNESKLNSIQENFTKLIKL